MKNVTLGSDIKIQREDGAFKCTQMDFKYLNIKIVCSFIKASLNLTKPYEIRWLL